MESLLYQLINHIKEQMPSLSLVDEDYGQLEAIEVFGHDPRMWATETLEVLDDDGRVGGLRVVSLDWRPCRTGLKWSMTCTKLYSATVLMRMGNSYERSHASTHGVTE